MWHTVTDLVLPRPCPGCGQPGPWCAPCRAQLSRRPHRVLPAPSADYDVSMGLPPLYALARYRGPVRAMILAAKEKGRRDLPPAFGAVLALGLSRLLSISVLTGPLWLVPAPTRVSAARSRGGDPITRMAMAAADRLASDDCWTAVAPCLYTVRDARDSVGLTSDQRRENLAGRIGWRGRAAPPTGAQVVLIDDVLTSGTTAAGSCAILRRHGHPVQAVLTLAAVPPPAGRVDVSAPRTV